MPILVKVTLRNWEKYNPRADRGNFSWFRFQNNFFLDQTIMFLKPREKLLFIFVCCEASKANAPIFTVRADYVSVFTGYSEKEVLAGLDELVLSTLLNGVERLTSTLQAASSLTDRTDRTDKQTFDSKIFDFESIYQRYPLKKGKGKGLKQCAKDIGSPEDFQALSAAIDNYREDCRKNKTEPKFIKHFSTFMSCWRDWIDPQAGGVDFGQPQISNPWVKA